MNKLLSMLLLLAPGLTLAADFTVAQKGKALACPA